MPTNIPDGSCGQNRNQPISSRGSAERREQPVTRLRPNSRVRRLTGIPGRELSLPICSKLALQLTTRRRTTVVANSALGHTLSLGCVIQARCAKLMLGDSGANPRWTQNRSFGRGGVRSASASIQEATMEPSQRMLSAGGALLIATMTAHAAVAQKSGGILNISHFDSPASVSLH